MSSTQTLRSRVADLWRSFSLKDGCEPVSEQPATRQKFETASSPDTHDSFIHRYLNGESNGCTVPEIQHGKSCYDLPSHAVAYMAPRVVASHTGPNQGLTAIVPNDSQKPFSADEAVQFIDDSPKKTGVLFCMGNPLLDISAEVDNTVLDRFGLKPNDAILAEDKHLPLYKELQEASGVDYVAGGATQNSCRVFQWVVRRENRCVYLGCIGHDDFGQILEKKAREAGVNVQYQYTEKAPTGTCAVLLTDGGTHRSLCANLAAANCFTIDHLLKSENAKLMENAKFYYISGFFLTVSTDSMLHVGKHATAKGKPFCLNLSAPFLCSVFKSQMLSVMPYVDILFGNESEAAEFARGQGWPDNSVVDIAKLAAKLPKECGSRLVVFTQGCDPVIVVKDDKVSEYPVERIPKEQIIDTNGAGDSFVGGFLAGYVQGKPIEECVALGVKCASMMIRQSGCSLPDRKAYEDVLGF